MSGKWGRVGVAEHLIPRFVVNQERLFLYLLKYLHLSVQKTVQARQPDLSSNRDQEKNWLILALYVCTFGSKTHVQYCLTL